MVKEPFLHKDFDIMVIKYFRDCSYCQMFTQKTLRHSTETTSVPEKCLEETSVDLFGPLPSSHHVLAVQDLAARYPVVRTVKSTNAKSVIPAYT